MIGKAVADPLVDASVSFPYRCLGWRYLLSLGTYVSSFVISVYRVLKLGYFTIRNFIGLLMRLSLSVDLGARFILRLSITRKAL
jgi:hypothetical protein